MGRRGMSWRIGIWGTAVLVTSLGCRATSQGESNGHGDGASQVGYGAGSAGNGGSQAGSAHGGDGACDDDAVTVHEGDLILETQAGVDGLLGIREVTGKLIMGGHPDWEGIVPEDPIHSFAALKCLTAVGRGMVGTGLSIVYNNTLTSLSGLENLATIKGRLDIWGNTALKSLAGLEGLTSVGDDVLIQYTVLPNLTGLDNLTSIGSELVIVDNDALTSLAGLEGITAVPDDLAISGNPALLTLAGLDNVTSTGQDLRVTGNGALEDLSGLESIRAVERNLVVSRNHGLLSLAGLENVTSVGGNLRIFENDLLPQCLATAVTHRISVEGDVSAYSNFGDCP